MAGAAGAEIAGNGVELVGVPGSEEERGTVLGEQAAGRLGNRGGRAEDEDVLRESGLAALGVLSQARLRRRCAGCNLFGRSSVNNGLGREVELKSFRVDRRGIGRRFDALLNPALREQALPG